MGNRGKACWAGYTSARSCPAPRFNRRSHPGLLEYPSSMNHLTRAFISAWAIRVART